MLRRVGDLPEELRSRLDGRDLIVFDGVCVLCSGFFRFVLRFDRAQHYAFATAQSPLGATLYRALGLSDQTFETILVVREGEILGHWEAVGAVFASLPRPWRAFGALRWLPRGLYLFVARRRYRFFGRYAVCPVPSPEVRERFAPGGFAPL